MKINNKKQRSIFMKNGLVTIIDQRWLPHELRYETIKSGIQMACAIKDNHFSGAGLIGAAAGYGMRIIAENTRKTIYSHNDENFKNKPEAVLFYLDEMELGGSLLKSSRPIAASLSWAVDRQIDEMKKGETIDDMVRIAQKTATKIANEDEHHCRMIGKHGAGLIEKIAGEKKKGDAVNILTHFSAGMLSFAYHDSAAAPIYEAFERGINIHVYVNMPGPLFQDSGYTAEKLEQTSIPYTIIEDNTGGHLIQHGKIDMCIAGTYRMTRIGDSANKIGTYQNALAARDNNIPFYTALPSSSFDWSIRDGLKEIPIEKTSPDETRYVLGYDEDFEWNSYVRVTPKDAKCENYKFDVTPNRLISALITERGVCRALEEDIVEMYPEHR